jgi:exodeoxyribonuclease III
MISFARFTSAALVRPPRFASSILARMPPKRKTASAVDIGSTSPSAEEDVGPAFAAEDPAAPKKKRASAKTKSPPPPPLPVFNASMRPPPCEEPTFRAISWNVAGLRALHRKDQLQSLTSLVAAEQPDVICLQETKLQDGEHCEDMAKALASVMPDWSVHWSCSTARKGYSGTAFLCRPDRQPKAVWPGIGHEDHDAEGRVLTAEYDHFFLVNCYVPNSGAGLKRLEYRVGSWDGSLAAYLKGLESRGKLVILTGDLNCAAEEIDIHSPKTNLRSAGFTVEERTSFAERFLRNGFVDAFRKMHPGVVGYTYWGYRGPNLRGQNKGWRLDYFLVSEKLWDCVHDCWHSPDVLGSDHCPLGIVIKTQCFESAK